MLDGLRSRSGNQSQVTSHSIIYDCRLQIGLALPAYWLLRCNDPPGHSLTLAPLLNVLNKHIKQKISIRGAA